MGAIQKHSGSDLKTQWERYENTEGKIERSYCVLFCNVFVSFKGET